VLWIGFCLAVPASADDHKTDYTLYLVRHAEKTSESATDPGLTATGERRANNLANWLAGHDIKTVWSSDTRRTRDTASPLAGLLGLEIRIYDPRKPSELQQKLAAEKENALVVGHSNTIPELVSALCSCEVESMEDTEHDRLYRLAVEGLNVHIDLLDQSVLFQLH
jgi:broad specificity phosphatase PhoE